MLTMFNTGAIHALVALTNCVQLMPLDQYADLLANSDFHDLAGPESPAVIHEGISAEGERFYGCQYECAAHAIVFFPDLCPPRPEHATTVATKLPDFLLD